MRILRGFLYLVIFIALAIGGVAIGARFSDGPIALFPGGPLIAGETIDTPVDDWSFAADVQEIEMQLMAQETSRITWIVVHDKKAYLPVSLSFPPGKTWHKVADENGAAILRIDGKKYPVNLSRVMDEDLANQIDVTNVAKYSPPPGGGDGGRWYFEATSR